jgi:alanine-glyoxylate transaminase / serine-glyoxylate transaminase / serine-pyruvate transaminase
MNYRWLPIMKAYEGGSAAYFATPPVNLIHAYHESLSQITKASPSLDERLRLHRETSSRIKLAAKELGLSQLPVRPEIAANGMTAVSISGLPTFFSELMDEPRVPHL